MPLILPLDAVGTITPHTTPPSQKPIQAPPRNEVPDTATKENAPVAQTPEESKQKEVENARFAALSRKEREILHKRRELAQKEKELDAKLSQAKPFEEVPGLLKQNPLEGLKKLGISDKELYEQLTNLYLTGQNLSPEQIAEAKATQIAETKIKEFQETLQRQQEQQTAQAYETLITQLKKDARQIVSTDSEKFPIVKATNAYDTAVEVVQEIFQRTGELVPLEEAIQGTQDFYEEGLLNLIKEVPQLKDKVLKLLQPLQEEKPSPQSVAPQKLQTLTHKTTTAPAPVAARLTAAERRQRALNVMMTGKPE